MNTTPEDAQMDRRTIARTLSGEYCFEGRHRMAYVVQRGAPSRGVDIGHAGGVDAQTKERLRIFRAGVERLVEQRAAEGYTLIGIDIVVEFLDPCPPEECDYGCPFMYDVVESETEPFVE
jgi:hypothetical protein